MSAAPGSEGTGRDQVSVEIALTADPELITAISRLVPQLSSSAKVPTAYELEAIVEKMLDFGANFATCLPPDEPPGNSIRRRSAKRGK